MDTPPERPGPIADLLARAIARLRMSRTVFDTADAHAEIANDEVTYRDPTAGLVTEQTFRPAILDCGHAAVRADQVGGRAASGAILCSQCLRVCVRCGSAVALAETRTWDDGQRYCITCIRAMRRRKMLATASNATLGFFVERKE